MFHSRDGVGAAEKEGVPPILSRGGQQSIYPGNTQRSRFSQVPKGIFVCFSPPQGKAPLPPQTPVHRFGGSTPFQGSMTEGLDLGLNH